MIVVISTLFYFCFGYATKQGFAELEGGKSFNQRDYPKPAVTLGLAKTAIFFVSRKRINRNKKRLHNL